MVNNKELILKILSGAKDGDPLEPIADKILDILELNPKETDGSNITPKEAAEKIWHALSDRRGFGLDSLQFDDPEIYEEIIAKMASIVERVVH
jgi:hypothetical protein